MKKNEANNGVTNVTNNKNKSKKSKKSGKSSNKTNNNQRQPKELNSVLTKMLNDIIRKDSYGIFYEPVNAKEVPDYYIVIKKPMNFQLMKRKLKSGNYLTLEAFLKDIELICNNAMIYNQKDTIFYKMAEKILSFASNLADKEKAYILPNTSFIGKSEMLDVENNLQYDNDNDNSNNNVNTTTMSNQESNYQENTQSAPTTKRYKKHKKNLNNHIRSNYLSDGSMRYNYFIQKQNDNNNTNEKQSYLSYLDNSNNPNNNLILDDHLYLNFGNSQGLSYLTSIARFTADLDSTLITESVNKHFNDITLNSHQFSNNIKNILDKNK
ncbi:Bromodomain-containing protein [Neoconidiobolus thromboides FSU 785]|nr:Bromodomain-containing protein [Neoconidiobolus thromboides FSU 785]